MPKAVPDRGDFVVISFTPQAGHEQAGRRNAIVPSSKLFNEATGFAAVCPITNQRKDCPLEVDLPSEGIALEDGFPVTGVILADQVKTLDWKARNLKVPKHCDKEDEQLTDAVMDCLPKAKTYLG